MTDEAETIARIMWSAFATEGTYDEDRHGDVPAYLNTARAIIASRPLGVPAMNETRHAAALGKIVALGETDKAGYDIHNLADAIAIAAASLQSSAVEGVGPFCQKCKGPWRHKPEPHCDHNCTPYWNPNPAETNALQQALNSSPTRADTVEECMAIADNLDIQIVQNEFVSEDYAKAWRTGVNDAAFAISEGIRALSPTKGENT